MTLGIGCHCRNERGSGQGYTCHYFGDPTGCEPYTEDPKKFYLTIVNYIEGETKLCNRNLSLGFKILNGKYQIFEDMLGI